MESQSAMTEWCSPNRVMYSAVTIQSQAGSTGTQVCTLNTVDMYSIAITACSTEHCVAQLSTVLLNTTQLLLNQLKSLLATSDHRPRLLKRLSNDPVHKPATTSNMI